MPLPQTTRQSAYISVNEAAAIIGCTVGRVRQMLLASELLGAKLNARAWAVDRKAAEKLAKNPSHVGRPRKHG